VSGSRRIGLDARLTRQMSVGMKTYVRELVARLPAVAPDLTYVAFDRGGNFDFDEQVGLPRRLRAAHLDLVHFMSQYVPLAAPRPFVITIHDLIHLRHPEYFKSKVGPYYRSVVKRACARAAAVITDDARTVDDLERFLGVDPSKVRVVPLGVNERFLAQAEPKMPPRPYLLYVGNHRAHKDLPTLFAAWRALSEPLDLYLTGPDDFAGELERMSDATRRASALGDVDDAELASWYAGAIALVHPALCEGFGLPMLEAMASGCPVVACEDAVPGVLASAALTFPAKGASALAARLEALLDDQGLGARLVKEGRALAQTLTWDACAKATAEIYRQVVEDVA
jgi:glycosyltransferase involved in cell wall biosynthesis